MFCMLPRKHLTGARIVSVTQPEHERMLCLLLDAHDELGVDSRKQLVVEMIGRSANVILVGEDGRIIDCMRRVDFAGDALRRLLPGMVASVQLSSTGSTAQAEAASSDYRLPVTAVQKAANGQLFVWAVEADSTVHRSNVVTGAVTGNDITISAGLQQGQRIVVEGYQKLSEGTKVEF